MRQYTSQFTFHYVSIKSVKEAFLITLIVLFTFHYVSIKSEFEEFKKELMNKFTFHYVSIKSTFQESIPVAKELIYIPLCIY